MSDQTEQSSDDQAESTDEGPQSLRQYVRRLERDAKQAQAAALQAREDAQRLRADLAFVQAGLGDLRPAQRAAVEGVVTEMNADAVRAACADLGIVADRELAEAAALERIREATGGPPPTPVSYEQEMAAAHTPQDVVAVAAKYGRLAGPQ